MQFHPDKNPGKEKWANEKFKEINEAYGVLGNPIRESNTTSSAPPVTPAMSSIVIPPRVRSKT